MHFPCARYLIPKPIITQPFVTELDLRVAHLPQSAIDYLREAMPIIENGDGEPGFDYEAWIEEVFA